jgi:hypothetical protein
MFSRVAFICLLSTQIANAADFDFIFGAGFDDATAMAPEGGNPATTLGDARKNVLTEAGRVWGALLVSNVRIVVRASFVDNQECMARSATLASAGTTFLFRNFPGAAPDTFYVSSLANAIAGRDLNTTSPDINVNINSKVNGNPACLGGQRFYYGFDHNTTSITPRGVDLLAVVLHEFAHGFGFASELDLTGENAGKTIDDSGAVTGYVQQIFDEQLARAWPMLTPVERVQSATRTGFLAWNGSRTNAQATRFPGGITGQGRFQLNAPAMIDEGSSVSHWTPDFSSPDLLMEPNISRTLTSIVDVTVCALQDIGWQVTRCPDSAARGATPVANSQMITVVEDTPTQFTISGSDAENEPLVFLIATQPSKGTLSSNSFGSPTMLTRSYIPNLNANGADSFSFTVSDGGTSSVPATVTINITPVNDPPNATDTSASATSGQAVPITLGGSDVDGDAVTFELVGNPANGTGSLSPGGVVTYQSNAGFTGMDSFTFRVRDAVTTSNTATVTINVSPSTVPVPGGRGGGGGAMNELLLLALGLLALTARLYKLRTASPQRAR